MYALPWWPKQLPWTSLRMMLDFPVACIPWIIIPPLVGRSDDKCSRTSRKSHFLPTNVVLDIDGTSKNRGLSGQFSLLKAGKIKKKRERMKSWTFYWISSSRCLFFWRITVHTMSLKFLFPTFFSFRAPLFWSLLKDYQSTLCLSVNWLFPVFFRFLIKKNQVSEQRL